jgi:hypothetical protein
MRSPTDDASARQHPGEPSPVPGRGGNRTSRAGSGEITEIDRQIAELLNRSTQELRLAWRQLHRTGPPQGLSRDLLIRALAHQLQERAAGAANRALRRRLPGRRICEEKQVLRSPARPESRRDLVRQWRGHAHTVVVRDDGFEYEGEHYRSLTVIAERITGAHWSGPRFFGLTKRTGASVSAEAGKREAQAGTVSRRKERVRCAIYTRKSSDEGLEQGSSIRCKRREACEPRTRRLAVPVSRL